MFIIFSQVNYNLQIVYHIIYVTEDADSNLEVMITSLYGLHGSQYPLSEKMPLNLTANSTKCPSKYNSRVSIIVREGALVVYRQGIFFRIS